MFIYKLLNYVGPLLTGIGGVFATSSLISKNADEKSEDEFRTKVLSDEDPNIDPWEDQDESEQESEDGEEGGEGGEGDSSSSGDGSESQQGESQENSGEAGGEENGSSDSSAQEGVSGQGIGVGGEGKGEESQLGASVQHVEMEKSLAEEKPEPENKEGVSEDGYDEALNDHIQGNRYGSEDSGMTQEDVEVAKKLVRDLKDVHGKLSQMVKD